MKTISNTDITNLGRPELPMRSAMVSEPKSVEVTMGNTVGAGISGLTNDD